MILVTRADVVCACGLSGSLISSIITLIIALIIVSIIPSGWDNVVRDIHVDQKMFQRLLKYRSLME